MYVTLATLLQFNFCYLLRFIISSSVHGAFSPSITVHAQNIGTQIFAKKVLRKFDTGIVKKLRKLQHWAKKHFLTKNMYYGSESLKYKNHLRIMQGSNFIRT